MQKIKVFISFHHENEEENKKKLEELLKHHSEYSEFFELINRSVRNGDIKREAPAKEIFKKIRKEHIEYANVTILILGKKTKERKHIDWEIAASLMRYGSLDRRKKNGLIILLTDDFIEQEKTNGNLDDKGDYSSLVNIENSGPRIYANVINKYALVESYSNMLLNPTKLKEMIYKCRSNSEMINPNNGYSLKINNGTEMLLPNPSVTDEHPFKINTKEECFEEIKDQVNTSSQIPNSISDTTLNFCAGQ